MRFPEATIDAVILKSKNRVLIYKTLFKMLENWTK